MLVERDLVGGQDLTFMVYFLSYRPRSGLPRSSAMAACRDSRGECVLSSVLIGRLIRHGLQFQLVLFELDLVLGESLFETLILAGEELESLLIACLHTLKL